MAQLRYSEPHTQTLSTVFRVLGRERDTQESQTGTLFQGWYTERRGAPVSDRTNINLSVS